jgi:hypothetical protein
VAAPASYDESNPACQCNDTTEEVNKQANTTNEEQGPTSTTRRDNLLNKLNSETD